MKVNTKGQLIIDSVKNKYLWHYDIMEPDSKKLLCAILGPGDFNCEEDCIKHAKETCEKLGIKASYEL